ncbi:zinc ABC transporter permease [Vibrio europaeus]|uniref:toxin VasX n=1 Tax=Vibrio europaeus TaxID=300876 RepID=UPI002341934D|nr:toxin VasX [Vibrio europaeus]MDC5848534.1 zinc ABC transporter permease [Vibrio europaeus]
MSTPNDDAKSGQTKDAQDPAGTCPLKKNKIQLVPVRYGLVETLSAKEHTKIPFETESKPLGIRLLRDGWIYVLVKCDSTWILHEYRVEAGKITKLLWQDSEVNSDERTTSIGEANLIFERCDVIYCSYSELQWTAKKCSQVIGSDKDRLRFMQKVNLSGFDATDGGTDLLTSKQASVLIAECSEQLETNTSDLDYQPYEWEHKSLFRQTDFTTISSSVLAEYREDHLYLVFNDDIGVLRDLASYQGLVAKSLEDWRSDEKQYQKYIEGTYIETQLQISPEKVDALAAMLGNKEFTDELSEYQKESVVNWIQEYDDKRSDYMRPSVGEKYRAMEKALGDGVMDKYRDLIYDIQDQFDNDLNGVSSWKIWNASHGKKGIRELIHQDEMENFLEKERKKLAFWDERLNSISKDRIDLFDRFYFAAWYFDSSTNKQLEELLAAEYSCIQDLCWSDAASLLVAEKLEEMPWVASYRALFTKSVDEYDKLTEAIGKKINEAKLIAKYKKDLAEINAIGVSLNTIINEQLRAHEVIQTNDGLNSFSQLIDSTYTPANTIGLTNAIETFFQKVNSVQDFNPSEVLRSYTGAAWLGVLQAYRNTDMTLGFASEQEMHKFNILTEQATKIRKDNTSLKNTIRQVWAEHRKKGRSGKPDVDALTESHKANQVKLSELEIKIHDSISPLGEGSEKAGLYIKGLTEAQKLDVKALASDHRTMRNVKVWSSLKAWDGLSAIITFCAIYNATKTYSEIKKQSNNASFYSLGRDLSSALAAVFGLTQGLVENYNKNAYKTVQTAVSKLSYGASLGRWTTVLGGLSYIFGGISSGMKAYEAGNKLRGVISKGNTGAAIKYTADGIAETTMTVVNGYGFIRSSQVAWGVMHTEKAARAAIWAGSSSRLLSIGIRVNMIGLLMSAVQLGVTAGYNYFSLSAYMQWFRDSLWGETPKNDSLQVSNEQLAKISSKPIMSIQQLPAGNALSLLMPGITVNELDSAGIEIAVYWLLDQQRNSWQPWTEAAGQQWVCLSSLHEALEIGLPIFPREANAHHGIGVELRYWPTPDSTEKSVVRYQTTSLNRLGLLSEVSMLKAKNVVRDNLLPLTTSQLKLQGA